MSPRSSARSRRQQKRICVGTIVVNFAAAPEVVRAKVLEILGVRELPNKRGLMALSPGRLGSAARLLDCWSAAQQADGRKLSAEIARLEASGQLEQEMIEFAAAQSDRVRLALLRWAVRGSRSGNPHVSNPIRSSSSSRTVPRAASLAANGGVDAVAAEMSVRSEPLRKSRRRYRSDGRGDDDSFAQRFAAAMADGDGLITAAPDVEEPAPEPVADQPQRCSVPGCNAVLTGEGAFCLVINPNSDSLSGLPDDLRQEYGELIDQSDCRRPLCAKCAGNLRQRLTDWHEARESREPWLLVFPFEYEWVACSLCGRLWGAHAAWTIKKQWRRMPKALRDFFDRHFGRPLCGDCGWTARNLVKRWRERNPKVRWNPFWVQRWLDGQSGGEG